MKNKALKVKDIIATFQAFPKRDIRKDFNKKNLFKKVKNKKYLYENLKTGEKYDIRNNLNNLSAREWTFFLCSVEVTNYPINGPESFCWNIRKEHPSPKPPQLMKKIIEFFTKDGEWILDPFMGVGGTLLGASLAKRNAVGIELEKKYIEIYHEVCEKLNIKKQIAINGNSFFIEDYLEGLENFFDLILTDPPYWNMQYRKKTGEARKKKQKIHTPFTNLTEDLGNIHEYDEYLEKLKLILVKASKFLKPERYLIVFTKDFQPKNNRIYMLHYDIVKKLTETGIFEFCGYKIWFDKGQQLYPFGYPYKYVSNIFHQYILIFRKRKNG